MSRKLVFILCFFAFLSCMSSMKFNPAKVNASDGYPVHNSDTGLNYRTIQEAIDAPETSDGDVIFVEEGIYFEHVVLNKSLTLIGENRSTTIIDGAKNGMVAYVTANNVNISDFTIQNGGSATSYGIKLMAESCTVVGNVIRKNGYGILLMESSRIVIIENIISDNERYGIWMGKSNNTVINRNDVTNNGHTGIESALCSDNIISANNISYNDSFGVEYYHSNNTVFSSNTIMHNEADGIALGKSHGNTIMENNIGDSKHGVSLQSSNENTIFHNNFIRNRMLHARSTSGQGNVWDIGYPMGGNYWSSCNGTDKFHGSFQNVAGSDGIGDNAYIIDSDNQDTYPLMGFFSDFDATSEYYVQTVCNSIISDFQSNVTEISFNVSGEDCTIGFCRICIPTALMNGTFKVFVNATEVYHTLLSCSNSTYSYLYFIYNHSTQEVVIIPEFSSFKIIPLLTTAITLTAIAVALAAILYKRKRSV